MTPSLGSALTERLKKEKNRMRMTAHSEAGREGGIQEGGEARAAARATDYE